MKEYIEKVKQFHEAFNIENNTVPTLESEKTHELRHRLMAEENDEYLQACKENDLVGIADALGDQLYILCGTILKHGMQFHIERVFNEIQRSNMSKLGEDGKPVIREDGKILKGPGYTPPNIVDILHKHH